MKTSDTWSFRSIMGKIMMGLVLAAMIGSIDVAPALGKNNKHGKSRYEHRGLGYDRDRYVQGRRVYGPYGYRERVYAPPRVIYAPPSPPGIRVFFPPLFIHP